MRHLAILLEAEKRILQRLRLDKRYDAWVGRGRSPAPFKPGRIKMRKEKRRDVMMALMVKTQLGRCVLCHSPLIVNHGLSPDHPERCSFDHVVSRSKHGIDEGNRIAAHRKCNSDKSDRDPTGCELIWLDVVNNAIEDFHKEQKALFHAMMQQARANTAMEGHRL